MDGDRRRPEDDDRGADGEDHRTDTDEKFDAGDLPAVLFSVDQINAALADPAVIARPKPNLVAQPPTTALVASPGAQGTVDPADCAPTMITGAEPAYRDSGYQAVYSVTMTEPGPSGEQSVSQSILTFPDADTAQHALLGVQLTVQRCAGPTGYGKVAFTPSDGGANEDWGFGASGVRDIHLPDAYYYWEGLRHDNDPSHDSEDQYTNSRTAAIKGNAIVEVAIRGLPYYMEAQPIIAAILKKMS